MAASATTSELRMLNVLLMLLRERCRLSLKVVKQPPKRMHSLPKFERSSRDAVEASYLNKTRMCLLMAMEMPSSTMTRDGPLDTDRFLSQ